MICKYPRCGNIPNLEIFLTRRIPELKISRIWKYPQSGNIPDLEISPIWKYPQSGNIHNLKISTIYDDDCFYYYKK